jgi:hypothetical protein
MNANRISTALARIEAASARIEATARAPRAGDADLQARHDRLRSDAGAALADLDRLIGTLETGATKA